jgi:hypothetical protein
MPLITGMMMSRMTAQGRFSVGRISSACLPFAATTTA